MLPVEGKRASSSAAVIDLLGVLSPCVSVYICSVSTVVALLLGWATAAYGTQYSTVPRDEGDNEDGDDHTNDDGINPCTTSSLGGLVLKSVFVNPHILQISRWDVLSVYTHMQ